VSLAACLLETHAHPFIQGASLLLYGTQNGGIMAFEMVGAEEPRLLLRARTPGGRPVLGLGVHRDSNALLAFTTARDGAVRALGWQMFEAAPGADGGVGGDDAVASIGRAKQGAAAVGRARREGRGPCLLCDTALSAWPSHQCSRLPSPALIFFKRVQPKPASPHSNQVASC
jgi:hypothetical protein